MRGRRAPLVDIAAIKREVLARENERREEIASRYLDGLESSVLAAMITRYEHGLFEFLEVDDFFALKHKALFGVLRALEAKGLDVDGEFLLADVGREIERQDAEQGKNLRAHLTDAFLEDLVRVKKRGEHGAHVVPLHEPAHIARAIEDLKATMACRIACGNKPLEVLDCLTSIRGRT